MKKLSLSVTVILLALLHETGEAANFRVQMSNYSFSPSPLTIGVGDTVTWTNTAIGTSHTTVSGDAFCGTNLFWRSSDLGFHGTYTFTFTNFAPATYTYNCVIHCQIEGMKGILIITNAAAPNVPPSVSITNPAAGAKFPAPANVVLSADAHDSGGSVTNVQFFSDSGLLATLNSQPYTFTVNNLAAGNYNFTATATDNLGLSATSTVVNVFVLTNAILSSPIFANGQFRFTIIGVAGQTYSTESSTNLQNWTAFATNLAPANTFNVTDSTSANILKNFYRARQDF